MATDMAQYRTLILWQQRPRRKTDPPAGFGANCYSSVWGRGLLTSRHRPVYNGNYT